MEMFSIYSEKLWKQMLEQYPDLKELAEKCNCLDNYILAQKIRQEYKKGFGIGILTSEQMKFAMELGKVEFCQYYSINQSIVGS